MAQTIMETLQERDNTHGEFTTHAAISQRLKSVMHETPGWRHLDTDQREALEMIQHKVARILNGNPKYIDNYRDIAGYATLVAMRMESSNGCTDLRIVPMRVVNGSLEDVS